MKKLSLAFDCDSVQSMFQEAWLEKYNTVYKDNVKIEEILSWDIEKYLTKCTRDELYELLITDGFFSKVKPQLGAKYVLDKFREAGHEVFTVTAYSPESCVDKSWWLTNVMGFEQDDIIFCNKKHRILADWLIDDGIHNLANFKGGRMLFHQSHNRNEPDYQYDVRVHDWGDIYYFAKKEKWIY